MARTSAANGESCERRNRGKPVSSTRRAMIGSRPARTRAPSANDARRRGLETGEALTLILSAQSTPRPPHGAGRRLSREVDSGATRGVRDTRPRGCCLRSLVGTDVTDAFGDSRGPAIRPAPPDRAAQTEGSRDRLDAHAAGQQGAPPVRRRRRHGGRDLIQRRRPRWGPGAGLVRQWTGGKGYTNIRSYGTQAVQSASRA